MEGGTAETSGIEELFASQVDHLSDKHLQFFRYRERGREGGREGGRERILYMCTPTCLHVCVWLV